MQVLQLERITTTTTAVAVAKNSVIDDECHAFLTEPEQLHIILEANFNFLFSLLHSQILLFFLERIKIKLK